MAWTRNLLWIASLGSALAWSVGARAQAEAACDANATDSENDPAKLFRCGKQFYAEERYEDSYRAYKRAFDIQQGYDIAGNLGNVEVRLGKYCDAVRHLRYVLENLPPSMDAELRGTIISKTNERLKEALAHSAVFKLLITPDGAQVNVDGQAIGTTPLKEELVLCEGKHNLTVVLEGYHPLEYPIDAKGGTNETVRMQLTPSTEPAPEPVDSGNEGSGIGPEVVPLTIVGGVVGLGLLGAGIGLHVVAGGKKTERLDISSTLDDGACAAAPPDPQCATIEELADQESTFRGAGTGLLVGGGVVLVATAVYAGIMLSGSGGPDQPSARLIPLAGPGGSGLLLTGSF